MYKMKNGYKTVINVKYKMIENFICGNDKEQSSKQQNPRFFRLMLKGLQDVPL